VLKWRLERALTGHYAVSAQKKGWGGIKNGAVFFHLKRRLPGMKPFLRDNNAELINCYKAVRDCAPELMRLLDEHLALFNEDRERYYYLVRSQHHPPGCSRGSVSRVPVSREPHAERASQKRGYTEAVIVERAARMIAAHNSGVSSDSA
jgi:hypothetical protein